MALLSQWIPVAFPVILDELTTKQGYRWTHPFLNGLVDLGAIQFKTLGIEVLYPDETTADIKQWHATMTWTMQEELQPTVTVTKAMLENLIISHDYTLASEIWRAPMPAYLVSKEYHHELGGIHPIETEAGFYCHLYTAFVPLPRPINV